MSSEASRTRLVSEAVHLTDRMNGRLLEIAAGPPESSFSAVVRYLFDVGLSRWKPEPQQYRIEMREKVAHHTKAMMRPDQVRRIAELLEMGYGRAVIFDLTLRLGDRWRPRGNSTENVQTPNTGSILQVAEEDGSRGPHNVRRARLPPQQEESIGSRLSAVREILRSNDTDLDSDADSAEAESEFP